METKKPWQSKSVLLGALTAVLGGVAMLYPPAIAWKDFLAAHLGEVGMVWGILAMVLRMAKSNISLED